MNDEQRKRLIGEMRRSLTAMSAQFARLVESGIVALALPIQAEYTRAELEYEAANAELGQKLLDVAEATRQSIELLGNMYAWLENLALTDEMASRIDQIIKSAQKKALGTLRSENGRNEAG